MKRAAFAVPGDLDTPTGGYAYDKRIIAELGALGWQIDVIDLGSAFPDPDAATRAAALAKTSGDGGRAADRDRWPRLRGDGGGSGVAARAAIRWSRWCITRLRWRPVSMRRRRRRCAQASGRRSAARRLWSSPAQPTAEILCRDYGVARERIAVIRPGVDVPALRPRSQTGNGVVNLLSVGSITPRKGYDLLIEVLGSLKELPWRLTIAGDTTRNASAFARLQADLARLKLQDRVVITGAVNEARLGQLYADSDVFVLASLFEGYGMVFGEAVAHGLPIVATAVGAAQEIVPPDAGMLVAPGDASALRDALRHVIVESDARKEMAQAAREASARLPQWRQSAIAFAQVLEALT